MRRRWKLLVVVGAVAVGAAVILAGLLPTSDDELAWLRKYHGKESWTRLTNEAGWYATRFEYQFDPLPEALIDEMKRKGYIITDSRKALFAGRLHNGNTFVVSRLQNKVLINVNRRRMSWLEAKVIELKRMLGIGS